MAQSLTYGFDDFFKEVLGKVEETSKRDVG